MARFLIRIFPLVAGLLVTLPANAQDLRTAKTMDPAHRNNQISRLNLLDNDYFKRQDLSKSGSASAAEPKSLRIMAIRVSFQSDTTELTTGDGRFILVGDDSTVIDPAPHDRAYFLAQLSAASDYYASVSNNQLILTGDVYPFADQGSYSLPHQMSYYNPNTTDEDLDARLAELFRDAIQAVDQTAQPNFSEFDVFVVFHAGVGQDFANDFDLTPHDIPSAFLNTEDLRRQLGNNDPQYPGIQTSNGFVREGIILPETQNQEGSEFALKATFVLLMGSQIGLPNLFDSETGRSGIGAWGLMDAGASNYFGLMPAHPTAWSKVFLGWVKPVELSPGDSPQIVSALTRSGNKIYKIPISAREYFLIENRKSDQNGDGFALGEDQFGHSLQFGPTGQFTAQIDTTAGERLGVISKIDEYDFAIPGSGILIWHIDDRIIEANYLENQVNADPNRRGVDLEEADGSQDIGQNFGFLSPGSGSELGVADDAFFNGNEIHMLANNTQTVRFGPESSPSSRSNSGAHTFIVLQEFSDIDTVMTFEFSSSAGYPGFPKRFSEETTVRFAPIVDSQPNNGEKAVFFTPGDNHIFAWDYLGSPLITRNDSITIESWDGQSQRFEIALLDTIVGIFSHPPVSYAAAATGMPNLFSVANDEQVIAWSTSEIDPATGFAQRIWELQMPAEHLLLWDGDLVVTGQTDLSLVTPEGITLWSSQTGQEILSLAATRNSGGSELLAVMTTGAIHLIGPEGNAIETRTLSLPGPPDRGQIISGYFSKRLEPDLVLSSGSSIYAFSLNLEEVQGFPIDLGESIIHWPVLTDIDRDGFGEIVLTTRSDLWGFNHNGTRSDGFPLKFNGPFGDEQKNQGFPLVLNTESDRYIFMKNAINDILMVSSGGVLRQDFTFSGGGATPAPHLTMADIDGDGIIEIIDANSDGFMNVRRIDLGAWQPAGSWLQSRFDASASAFNPAVPADGPAPASDLLVYAYNYPNPTEGGETRFRFFLSRDAQIAISVYDQAGDAVANLETMGLGSSENEIVWSLQDISSGVYLARFEANDGSSQAVKIVKVAVVK